MHSADAGKLHRSLLSSAINCSHADCVQLSFRQIGFQKTLRHFLHPAVRVPPHPHHRLTVELQLAMVSGPMPQFTHVFDLDDSVRYRTLTAGLLLDAHSKAHSIPRAFSRQPPATLRVAQVAELFERLP